MTSETCGDHEDRKIFIDEDWKSRVEAEKNRLDAEAERADSVAEGGTTEEGGGVDDGAEVDFDLPPASFLGLVQEFATRALVSLGRIRNPITGESSVDLPAAKYAIDMLAVLEDKAAQGLDPQEKAFLAQTAESLRLVFVQTVSAPPPSPGGSEG